MTEYVPYYRCVPMAGGELILFLAKNDDMVEGEVIKMPRSLGNGVHGLESLQPARWGRFRRFGPDQKVPTTSELVEAVKKLSHQADLVLGVMLWQDYMRSVREKTHVPHEPRRAVPLRLILSIITCRSIGKCNSRSSSWSCCSRSRAPSARALRPSRALTAGARTSIGWCATS